MNEPVQTLGAPPRWRFRRWTRWSFSGAIVAFWLTMMWLLLAKEIWPKRMLGNESFVTPEKFVQNWKDFDEWMNIVYKGKPLGVVRSQITRQSDQYFLASARLRIVLPFGILRASLTGDASALLDSSLTMQDAALDCSFIGKRMRIEATVSGDSLYYAVLNDDNLVNGGRVLVPAPPSLYQAARTMLARQFKLETGQSYAVPVFDPLWNFGSGMAMVRVLEKEPIVVEPGQEIIQAFKLETIFNDIKTYSWVDDEGRTVRQEIGRNLAFVRTTREAAIAIFPDLDNPVAEPKVNHERLRAESERNFNRPINDGVWNVLRDALRSE